MRKVWVSLCLLLLTALQAMAQEIPPTEFRERRRAAMEQLPDGILLLHARSSLVNADQLGSHGFRQDANFFYFTGLGNLVSAILALDGTSKQTWLFVPTKLSGMGELVTNAYVQPGPDSEKRLLIDRVVDWNEFAAYLDGRLSQGVKLYTDDNGAFMFQPSAESNPPGLAPVEDPLLIWRQALETRWPKATINSATAVVRQLRAIKSDAEVRVLRRVGAASTAALLAGVRAIRPGKTQRAVEAEIVRACILAGAEGPSFWPLAATGPNSAVPKYLEGLADYRHMNRVMRAGEVTHLDLGCDLDHYGGDVGRTIPVSGKFNPGQRETWEMLVAAYRAGLGTMRDGVTRDQIYQAGLEAIRKFQPTIKTPLGKRALELLLSKDGTKEWFLHASGVECCEIGPELLKAGMVVVFEPSVTLDEQGFYLEDMVLVTKTGYEVLTPGIPYSADEIEKFMAGRK